MLNLFKYTSDLFYRFKRVKVDTALHIPEGDEDAGNIRLNDGVLETKNGDWQEVSGIPAGGTTGQIFKKLSDTDYDANWESASDLESVHITGTGGLGYVSLPNQSSAPASPASGVNLYVDNNGFLSIKQADGTILPLGKDSGEQPYTETPVWTFGAGFAPSGTTHNTYRLTQFGPVKVLRINLLYSVGGNAVTQVVLPLPAGVPAPVAPSGLTVGSGVTEILYYGIGTTIANKTSTPAANGRVAIRGGSDIIVSQASNNTIGVWLTIIYW